jgi:hypothetical protein
MRIKNEHLEIDCFRGHSWLALMTTTCAGAWPECRGRGKGKISTAHPNHVRHGSLRSRPAAP